MSCRSEHLTYENHAPLLRLQFRLQALSHRWEDRRLHQIRVSRFRKMRRKVRIYLRQVRGLHRVLNGMIKAWEKDPGSITPQDWEKAVEGKEKKVVVMYGKRNPRDKWPEQVPYLNFVALYERERKVAKEKKETRDARRQAKRKAEAKKKAEAAKKVEAMKKVEAEKEAKAKAKAKEIIIPYDDPEAMAKLIQEREHLNNQLERQMELLRRSKIDPSFVEHDTWMKAVEGTDALKTDSEIFGYVELARRRKMGEKCDGWVRGRYFGRREC